MGGLSDTMARSLLTLGLAAALARAAQAQTPWTGHLAAGPELLSTPSTGAYRPGLALEAGVGRRLGGGRLRVELTLSGIRRTFHTNLGFASAYLVSATVDGRLDLPQLGLPGLYALVGAGGGLLLDRRPVATSDVVQTRTATESTRLFSGGLGYRWKVGRAMVALEVRRVVMENPNVMRRSLMPLTLGLRF
jgi:hypothetical protein